MGRRGRPKGYKNKKVRSDKGKRSENALCPKGHNKDIVGRTNDGHCVICSRLDSKKFYYKINKEKLKKKRMLHREEINANTRKWYANNKDKVRDTVFKRYYNITLNDYNKMFEEQNGKCAGCLRPQSDFQKSFSVDHDHSCCPGEKSCGECIRGLLCNKCNTFLGHLDDNIVKLKRLIKYLKSKK